MKAKWCMNCKHLKSYEKPWMFGLILVENYCEKHPRWQIKINSVAPECKKFVSKYKEKGGVK